MIDKISLRILANSYKPAYLCE